jgi:hypothetical protein
MASRRTREFNTSIRVSSVLMICRVELQVSFGKGDKFWTNLFPTELVAKHQKDIKRFETAIRWIRRLEVLFALIPIKITLKLWGLSDEFIDYMILPRYVPPPHPMPKSSD